MHKPSDTPDVQLSEEMKWILLLLRRWMYIFIREVEKKLNVPAEENPYKILRRVDKS